MLFQFYDANFIFSSSTVFYSAICLFSSSLSIKIFRVRCNITAVLKVQIQPNEGSNNFEISATFNADDGTGEASIRNFRNY